MSGDSYTPYLVGAAVLGLSISLFRQQTKEWELDKTAPALGNAASNPISYYLAALRILGNANEAVTAAYKNNPTGVFRIPRPFRWEWVASGPQRVAELAGVSEEVLSFQGAVNETLQTKWTIGSQIADDPWHVHTVRGSLTRNLARCFPEVRDEIVHAFRDVVGESKEWKTIQVLPTSMKVVSRTSNRLFVGLPLCRDPDFIQLNIDYTVNIFTRGQIIALFPEFIKPLIVPILSSKNSSLRYALKFLGPLLEERLEAERTMGKDRPDRPNDLISWLLDYAPEYDKTPRELALRILTVNMAAIHTSSTTLAAALYDLAAYPAHIAPMREEALRVVGAEGWSKAALNSMHRIDSFLRESQRLRGASVVAMTREVRAEGGFVFGDGVRVPRGAILSVVADPVQRDGGLYEGAECFDGFRFSRAREASAAAGAPATATDGASGGGPRVFNRQMVSTAPDHVVFGHQVHACPGRFFAATELKAMLAHILIEYDVEAAEGAKEGEEGRPRDAWFAFFRMPSPTGEVRVRRRVREEVE
ncbi:Cytochrome P450 [Mycena chlorophos]|uniref:Cytochrome P450 n=1 Tax=Mycena chlorophos TaxID=658473 RepID=A0A8H6WMY3_MYCCL|nr:Cytochrome P450 [Mycena chlorophos]